MERVYFREYKGKEIYYVDYSNLKSEQNFLAVLDITNTFRKKHIETKEQKSQLMLINLENSFIIGEAFARLKEAGNEAKPYLKKQAVFGISGTKQVFLNLYNKIIGGDMRAFSTEEEAFEWLILD